MTAFVKELQTYVDIKVSIKIAWNTTPLLYLSTSSVKSHYWPQFINDKWVITTVQQ